jgi:hypothetical protein
MRYFGLLLLLCGLAACNAPQQTEQPAAVSKAGNDLQIASDVAQRLARFAPTELTADLSTMPTSELEALRHILLASQKMDDIFLRQVWRGNPVLQNRLQIERGPLAKAAKTYFAINFGPWDRLNGMEPFIGKQAHPEGAGYYPEDMTKDEFNAWVEQHPDAKEAMESLTTIVQRKDGGLEAVPYSVAYSEWLQPAAAELRQAAAATDNESLRKYLNSRADAFLSDDYFQSDLDWMDLNAPIEVTIGPYETYEDGLFGYKSAFESFVTIALPEESAKLDRFKNELPALERNLPEPDRYKNFSRGTDSPIRVVDMLYNAGDAKAGVQTIAFNLPNDERVREAKGSKKVLLRNLMRAKYDQILVPIAKTVLAPDDVDNVSFDAYFDEVLHHELSHGLGPGTITVDGRKTEVRLELKELYSTIEEAKADVMGVYNILHLMDKGVISPSLRESLEPTYLAGLFRSARFGVDEAHGQGVVAQFNYLTDKGAIVVDSEGRYHTVSEKFPGAIRDLLHDMLILQATGDYQGTAAFLDRWGKPDANLRAALEQLKSVAVDIRPLFSQAEKLAQSSN